MTQSRLAVSRYDFQSINGEILSSFPAISPQELQSDTDVYVKLRYGQRIDNLAYTYLGDGRLWWIICLLNGLKTPFDSKLITGTILRVPTSTAKIIRILEQKNIKV
jgi:hypothetical protein